MDVPATGGIYPDALCEMVMMLSTLHLPRKMGWGGFSAQALPPSRSAARATPSMARRCFAAIGPVLSANLALSAPAGLVGGGLEGPKKKERGRAKQLRGKPQGGLAGYFVSRALCYPSIIALGGGLPLSIWYVSARYPLGGPRWGGRCPLPACAARLHAMSRTWNIRG